MALCVTALTGRCKLIHTPEEPLIDFFECDDETIASVRTFPIMPTSSAETATEYELDVVRREMDRAKDEFYRCMTAWTIAREANDSGRQCYKFALIYSDAIDRCIECLEREAPAWSVLRERQAANEMKSTLSKDLDYLSKFHLAQPNKPSPETLNGNDPAGAAHDKDIETISENESSNDRYIDERSGYLA